MKLADTIASAIVVAAVLLSAYAVGLLIREARTGDLSPAPQVAVADNNNSTVRPQAAALVVGGSAEAMQNVPEQAVDLKEQPQSVAGPNSVPQQSIKPSKPGAGGRRSGKGPRDLSPQQRERMRQKLESMSDEKRQ